MTDEPTIQDLCKPLSATVMPQRLRLWRRDQDASDEALLADQRKTVGNQFSAKRLHQHKKRGTGHE